MISKVRYMICKNPLLLYYQNSFGRKLSMITYTFFIHVFSTNFEKKYCCNYFNIVNRKLPKKIFSKLNKNIAAKNIYVMNPSFLKDSIFSRFKIL